MLLTWPADDVSQVCDEIFKRKTEIEASGSTKLQVSLNVFIFIS